jgi:Lamin Tail Domain/Bacterial Ig domain/Immunoglobulin domain
MSTHKLAIQTSLKLLVAILTLTIAVSAWAAGSASLVIAEVYGAGGNSGATLRNDYAVIFNRSAASVTMSGYSIQYNSASGSSSWQVAALTNAVIPAGGYYLVQMNSSGSNGSGLPTPDSTNNLALAANAGKIALVNNTTALSGANPSSSSILDLVGYGSTATGYEGSGPTAAPSATTSVQRGNQGCTDTDNNSADFTAATPNPRNSASSVHACNSVTAPSIAGLSPASSTVNAGNAVTFVLTTSAGDVPLTYYWLKETAGATNLIAYYTTNTTSGTLTLPSVLKSDAANYQVIVSNASSVNATSDIASLSVTDPSINMQPASQISLPNGSVQFSVIAAGSGSLAYNWYYCAEPNDNTQLTTALANGTLPSGLVVAGATSSTLLLTNVPAAAATNFAVVVTGTYGSVTSSVVSLAVATTSVPLAYWTFNGNFNTNNPAPYQGIGTASATNVTAFSQSTADGADPTPGVNYSWGTKVYPPQGTSNKLAGVRFNASTVGAKNIGVSFDLRGTASASKYFRLQYTTNGTAFVDYPAASTQLAAGYYLQSYNLAGFPGVANNPNFGVRVMAEFESTAKNGNTNNANYVGVTSGQAYSNDPSTGGTMSYDIVKITGDAITTANQPPTVGTLTNLTINDGTGGSENFTIGDDSDSPGALSVTAISLDPGASLSFTYNNNGDGTYQLGVSSSLGNTAAYYVPVMVTVTDSSGDSTVSWFTVTVLPANAPPVLAGFPSFITNTPAGTPLVIHFLLNDDHTDPATITPLALSQGNTNLIPSDSAHLTLGGSGTNRTLTITPVAGQLGTAFVAVGASDGSLVSAAGFYLVVRQNTNQILVDSFNYAAGSLTTNSALFWAHHSGTTNGELQVANGQITVDGINHAEDVNAPLIGAPYPTNGSAVLYARFSLNCTTLPTAGGAYFAHFKDDTTSDFYCRIWVSSNSPTTYRVGIGNTGAASATTAQVASDLSPNVSYTIVARMVVSNGVSTVWVNPVTEADSGATDSSVVTNGTYVSAFAFRENSGEGILNVSNLVVGTTFNSVIPPVSDVPPTANPDSYSLTENTANNLLNPLANDVFNMPYGTLILAAIYPTNGMASISGTNVLFTPASNFVGTATVGYAVSDGFGGTNRSLVTITVTNIPPQANPDAGAVAEYSAGNLFSPLANDVVETTGGSLHLVGATTDIGSVAVTNSGQQIVFAPNAGFYGSGNVYYQVSDSIGGTNTGTITVNVTYALPQITTVTLPGKIVIQWPDSSFILQSAPNVEGPYSNVPDASSPFTNNITADPSVFFRLIHQLGGT